MTSYMTIFLRVVANKAEAVLARTRGEVSALGTQVARTNRMAPLGQAHITSLMKFGNQLQWTGRMLMYNFTLPLAIAGTAATKWAMDQEKAMTHVAKVYGDTKAAAQQFKRESDGLLSQAQAEAKARRIQTQELNALDDAFTAISNHYAVQKDQVLEVAGAWAAAGASGRDLAEAVNQTMEAIIIGDMDAGQATKSLISIQAQYNLSTKQLQATLANLNSVENQTAANMSDLIIGFEKAAGVARAAGVDTNQLAAYIAALVPASGSAATAGNALKTIFSRLIAPTKETTQVLEHMGFNIKSVGWQSATVSERLDMLAGQFDNMSSSAQNAAASVIASRWQVNRFDILMREIVSDTGNYAKALDASSDQAESFARMQKELNTVLQSDPRALQRMWVMLQNAMVKIIQPLIPYIIYLADRLAALADSFSSLNPYLQKWILFLAVALALVGPVVRYIGALTTLYGVFAIAVLKAGRFLGIFYRTMVDSEGAMYVARSGVLQLIGAFLGFLMLPFKMIGTVIMGTLGAVSGALRVVGAVILNTLAGAFIKAAPIIAGSINAIARVILGRGILGALSALGGSIVAAFSGMMASVAGVFTTLRVAQYVWLTGSIEMFKTFVLRAGAIFSLLPAFIAESMAAVWTLLTLPGALSGRILAIWGALTTAIAGMWGRMMAVMSGITLRGALIGAWTALARGIAAVWTALTAFVSRGWIRMLAFVASPSAIMGVLSAIGGVLASAGTAILAVLTSPWTLAIAAIIGVLYIFRDQVGQIWNNIVNYFKGNGAIVALFENIRDGILNAFNALPQGVQNAMIAVVNIVKAAAMAVYNWFSYINPFAHHSPSLVENVTNGVEAINTQFAKLSNIKKYTDAAYAEIKRFGELTAQLGLSAAKAQQAEDRKTLRKAGAGDALASYNRLVGILNKLNPLLDRLEDKVNAQQRVVDAWQKKVDAANRALERQQDKLDDLQGVLDKYQSKLDAAQDSLNYYASAPLKGMQAMENQIFDNQMAQTKLRLEMMKMEDVAGTYDDIKSKLDEIAGAQELLSGERNALRMKGAGSEILKQYDDQLAALEAQKSQYVDTANQMSDMQTQLDLLQRQAEKLDLVKAMKFDRLQHEIELAANQMKELSFDDIMEGIKAANEQIDKYGPKVDEASKAVERQQKVVDRLTAARDRLQDRLDKETNKLDRIQAKYNDVNDAIQAINQSISDVVSNAETMNQKLEGAKAAAKDKGSSAAGYISPGLQNLLDAGNAGFPDPGGLGIPPRSDWSSQVKGIDKFTQDLADQTSDMFANINPFAPLKDKAAAVWDWIKQRAADAAAGISDFFSHIFDGVSMGGDASSFMDSMKATGEFLTEVLKDIGKFIKAAWDLLGPDLIRFYQNTIKGFQDMWNTVGPELAKFGDLVKPLGQAFVNLWKVIKPLLAIISLGILGLGKLLLSVMAEIIRPLLKNIGDLLAGLIRIIRGALEIIVGIFTLDFGMIWQGVKDIFTGLVKSIWAILKGGVQLIWDVVKGLVKGIWGFFKWLWDELVGHSIVPDIVNGIIDTFKILVTIAKWIWNHVIVPIFNVWKMAMKVIIGIVKIWWKVFTGVWKILWTLGKWWWDHILKPIWDAVVFLWDHAIKPAIELWWKGITTYWKILWTLAKWWWEHILKPIWDAVVFLWNNAVKPALAAWWEGIKLEWAILKKVAGWLWDHVLQPIWITVKYLWSKYVKPALKAWWTGIKIQWAVLKKVAVWLWDNVLEPAWNKIKDLWKKTGPELKAYWERLKQVWNNLKQAAIWVWENILRPVFDKIKDLWNKAREELRQWWDRIKSVWDKLRDLGGWIKENVMDPIFNAFKDGWTRIKEWMSSAKDLLTEPARNIVNAVIGAINTMINGLNAVSNALPGIDFHVNTIQKFESGGEMPHRRVGSGFKTTGARAIVGEGKANHPEYVIPTDPTHRRRATALLLDAATRIGVFGPGGDLGDVSRIAKSPHNFFNGIPGYDIGGILGDAWGGVKNITKSLLDEIADLPKHIVAHIMDPALNVAENLTKKVGWEPPEAPALSAISKVRVWAHELDDDVAGYVGAAGIQGKGGKALQYARSMVGTPYKLGGFGPGGIDCSGFMSAIANVYMGKPPYSNRGTTASFPWGWAPFKPGAGAHDGFTIGSTPQYPGSSYGHMAGTLQGVNVESRGGTGVIVGPGARGYGDPGFNEVYHLAQGAIIRANKRRGGILANIGEGKYDEVVQPLPPNWANQKNTGGDTHIHINGNLEFPNITDGSDAEQFIRNLKVLAKD